MYATDIDRDTIPAPADGVAELEIGQETLLLTGGRTQLHLLNPIAAVVWSCVDGAGSALEIATDLAEETGAPADVVLADVVALLQSLGTSGALADVIVDPDTVVTGPARPEPADEHTEPRYIIEPPST